MTAVTNQDATSEIYGLISYLLSYPDEAGFRDSLPDAKAWVLERIDTHPVFSDLLHAIEELSNTSRDNAAKAYVDVFDFRESTSLYLTSHELGDSRSRGPALIALRTLFQQYGFEEATEELPDYLPTLFEFLSVVADKRVDIEQRLAAVCRKVHSHLDRASVYSHIFNAAILALPDAKAENPFPFHEKADLDELPYPLMHGE